MTSGTSSTPSFQPVFINVGQAPHEKDPVMSCGENDRVQRLREKDVYENGTRVKSDSGCQDLTICGHDGSSAPGRRQATIVDSSRRDPHEVAGANLVSGHRGRLG